LFIDEQNNQTFLHLQNQTSNNQMFISQFFKSKLKLFISKRKFWAFCFIFMLCSINFFGSFDGLKSPDERDREELNSIAFHSNWTLTKIPHPIHIYTKGPTGNEVTWINVQPNSVIPNCPIDCYVNNLASNGVGDDVDAILYPGPHLGKPTSNNIIYLIFLIYF